MTPSTIINANQLAIGVPTSTIIARRAEDDWFNVCVIKHSAKHRQRITLIGGKRTGEATHEDTAKEEFAQEVGGLDATIHGLSLWAVKSDRLCDVREVTLGRVTDEHCPPHLSDIKVTAYYGYPDYIYTGVIEGTPSPNDGEAQDVTWIDVRDIVITEHEEDSQFGAQHDLVLALYRWWVEHFGGLDENRLLSDFKQLRATLIEWQSETD